MSYSNGLAVSCSRLTKAFGDIRALDALDLDIPRGAIYSFLGPNGAGKTTTINLLLGLLEPTSGSARVLGHEVPKDAGEVRRRSGVVLEYPGIYERMTAEDNLKFFGRAYGVGSSALETRIKELLTHFGLFERRTEMAGSWSRGMRQRLALARALIHEPSLLFLDEPTAGLDPVVSSELREELLTLVRTKGVTLLLATHNLSEAEHLSDKVAVINDGRLVALDEPKNLKSAFGRAGAVEISGTGFTPDTLGRLRSLDNVASVFTQDQKLVVTLHPGGRVPDLIRMLVNEGVEIEEVRRDEASFEEAMLQIMEGGSGGVAAAERESVRRASKLRSPRDKGR